MRLLQLRQEGAVDAPLPPAAARRDLDGLQRPARPTPTRRRSRTRSPRLTSSGEVDRVVVVYNAFVSPLVQRVTVSDVLPISAAAARRAQDEPRQSRRIRGDFFFEPEPRDILERLLPVYVETELYRALLESAASEQGARMTAMRNASKSAGELIDTLTLAMNRARQAEITQEILEVVAGADALTLVAFRDRRVSNPAIAVFSRIRCIIWSHCRAMRERGTQDDDSDMTVSRHRAARPRERATALASEARSQLFWERFREDKAALVGAVVILVLILIAIFGGPIAAHVTGHPQHEATRDDGGRVRHPEGPEHAFWFGADGDRPRPLRPHDVRRAHVADRRRRRLRHRRPRSASSSA